MRAGDLPLTGLAERIMALSSLTSAVPYVIARGNRWLNPMRNLGSIVSPRELAHRDTAGDGATGT